MSPASYLELFCQFLLKDCYISVLHQRLGLPPPTILMPTPLLQPFQELLASQNLPTSAGTGAPPDPGSDLYWIDLLTGPIEGSEVNIDLLTGNGKTPSPVHVIAPAEPQLSGPPMCPPSSQPESSMATLTSDATPTPPNIAVVERPLGDISNGGPLILVGG